MPSPPCRCPNCGTELDVAGMLADQEIADANWESEGEARLKELEKHDSRRAQEAHEAAERRYQNSLNDWLQG